MVAYQGDPMRLSPLVLASLLSIAGCGGDQSGNGADGTGSDDGGGGPDLNAGIDGGGCGLRTCASAKANCGPIGDGCEGLIDCGTCTAPQTCGGGGTPSVCGGMMGCIP